MNYYYLLFRTSVHCRVRISVNGFHAYYGAVHRDVRQNIIINESLVAGSSRLRLEILDTELAPGSRAGLEPSDPVPRPIDEDFDPRPRVGFRLEIKRFDGTEVVAPDEGTVVGLTRLPSPTDPEWSRRPRVVDCIAENLIAATAAYGTQTYEVEFRAEPEDLERYDASQSLIGLEAGVDENLWRVFGASIQRAFANRDIAAFMNKVMSSLRELARARAMEFSEYHDEVEDMVSGAMELGLVAEPDPATIVGIEWCGGRIYQLMVREVWDPEMETAELRRQMDPAQVAALPESAWRPGGYLAMELEWSRDAQGDLRWHRLRNLIVSNGFAESVETALSVPIFAAKREGALVVIR